MKPLADFLVVREVKEKPVNEIGACTDALMKALPNDKMKRGYWLKLCKGLKLGDVLAVIRKAEDDAQALKSATGETMNLGARITNRLKMLKAIEKVDAQVGNAVRRLGER